MQRFTNKSSIRRRSLRIVLGVAIAVGLYVGTYVANSSRGGYWLKPERDGKTRYGVGLSLHTAILWQPAYGYSAPFNSDLLGTIFSPLVALDRAWIHPTMDVSEESTFEWINQHAQPGDIHPRFRGEFIEIKKEKSQTPEVVVIAQYSNRPEGAAAGNRAMEILHGAKIQRMAGGSAAMSISVPADRASEAFQLLAKAIKVEGLELTLRDPKVGVRVSPELILEAKEVK